MCCPSINQHLASDDRMSPELAEKMLDVIVAADLGPLPQTFADKILSFCEAQMLCTYSDELHDLPCNRTKAVQCQGGAGCHAKLCNRHVWVCEVCFKSLCGWCFDKRRHECGRPA